MHRIDHKLDWSLPKSAEDIKNFLQRGTISFFYGIVLEIINKLLLGSCVLKLMQNKFHIDIK